MEERKMYNRRQWWIPTASIDAPAQFSVRPSRLVCKLAEHGEHGARTHNGNGNGYCSVRKIEDENANRKLFHAAQVDTV